MIFVVLWADTIHCYSHMKKFTITIILFLVYLLLCITVYCYYNGVISCHFIVLFSIVIIVVLLVFVVIVDDFSLYDVVAAICYSIIVILVWS